MAAEDIVRIPKGELASAVINAWKHGDNDLTDARANYWLNLAFYLGHQWIWWDKERRTVHSLTGRSSDRDRVRARMNRIRPRINSLMGRLTTKPLSFEIRAAAADDATQVAARITEKLLEYRRTEDGWEELRADEVFSILMGGTALLLPQWDADCDEVKFDAFNIAEFTLEPGTRRPRDARWMIVARAVPVEWARDTYGLDDTPAADAGDISPLHSRLVSTGGSVTSGITDRVTVFHYFERPTNKSDGRVAVVIDKKVVEYLDWPYPFKHLPGYCFRADVIPQRWYGDTPMNDARPIQAAYNLIRSTTLENAKKAATSRLMVPLGSLRDEDELDDEPGALVHYMPDATGGGPHWLEAPNLPRDIRYEADKLEMEMDDCLFTHAVTRGQAPGDRNSGLALSILAEKDDTPLGVLARDQQAGWQEVTKQAIQIYAKRVTKPRTARVVDAAGEVPVTIEWTGEQIAGSDDVFISPDSVMPHSRAATQAMLIELKQTFPEQFQNIPPEVFLRMLDMSSSNEFREAMDDDVACAVWENAMLMQGQVELPMPWHDHAVHIAEHNRERNSRRYRYADDDTRELMDDHIVAHEQILRDEAAKAMHANQVEPGLAALPNADNTLGSLVPPDHVDAMQQQQQPGMGPPMPGPMI